MTGKTQNRDLSKETIEFFQEQDMGARDWGTETLLGIVPGKYSMKKLFVKAGSKGGLQYHHLKDECGYMISGRMIVRYDDGSGNLVERIVSEGDTFHFPPGAVHQEEAITDCVLIEASTPHFNDRVRVEKEYGIESNEGLPSTSIDEVIIK